jgi:hypothetical protein
MHGELYRLRRENGPERWRVSRGVEKHSKCREEVRDDERREERGAPCSPPNAPSGTQLGVT